MHPIPLLGLSYSMAGGGTTNLHKKQLTSGLVPLERAAGASSDGVDWKKRNIEKDYFL